MQKMPTQTILPMKHERQGRELHMIKKEEGMEKRQPTGPEPEASKSIADPLAAELRVLHHV